MSALVVEGLTKRYGGLTAVSELGFVAEAGEVTAIIGPNGAGKTTALNLISGAVVPSAGRVQVKGRDVTGCRPHDAARQGLGRTYQSPQLFPGMSTLETVMVGRHLATRAGLLASAFRLPAMRRAERDAEARSRAALERVGVAEADWGRPALELAYGVQRRVEIARALAMDVRVLLLDEPAAGLNPRESEDLSALILDVAREGCCVVLVEHDMDLVMSISSRVVVMNFGCKIADGLPAAIQADPAVVEAYLGVEDAHEAEPANQARVAHA